MSKLFSDMLAEMGFNLPAGRARFNRPMPTRSSQVDINPDPDTPDTGITSGAGGSDEEGDDEQVPFDLGDDQIVVMSAKALRKLLGGALDDEGNEVDGGEKLGFDELPDADDLFGSDKEDSDGSTSNADLGGVGGGEDPDAEDFGFGNQADDLDNGDGTGLGDDSFGPDGQGDEEDPDKQGTLRKVKGARLTFKRQMPDGTFSEMWVYNVGEGIHDTLTVKRAILSGTDIPDNHFESADGKQRYKIVTMGNAQIIKIEGLPN